MREAPHDFPHKLGDRSDGRDGAPRTEVLLTSLAEMQVGDLLDQYLVGSAFRRLAPSTREEYARVARHIDDDIGAVSIGGVRRAFIRAQRERWSSAGHWAATLRLQILKNAMQPLIDDKELPANLFVGLNRVRGPNHVGEPHPVWKHAEFEAVLKEAAHMPGLMRAIGLARYGGFRRNDLCRISPDARVHEAGRVRYRWTSGKAGVAVEHVEDERLTRLLDVDTPAVPGTIAYNTRGMPWKPRQLCQALECVPGRLAAAGEVRAGLTLHGLRHTRGVELAEAGCSDAVIMAQLGHTTDRSAQIYRRQASRRRLGDVGQALVDAHRSGEGGLGMYQHRGQSGGYMYRHDTSGRPPAPLVSDGA